MDEIDAARRDGARVVIRDAHVRYLELPTGLRSFVLPNGQRTPTSLSVLAVRLTDDDGATGHSLLWAQRSRQLPVLEACLRYVAESVVGRPAGSTGTIVDAMRRSSAFFGGDGAIAFGVSGFEMAVQDLRCSRAGLCLSDVIGRKHDHLRAYRTGLMLTATVDELVEEAAAFHAGGFRAIKMIVGKPTIEEDIERVRAVKDSLPPDTTLMVDALQRWDHQEAVRALERLGGLDLAWVEDPIRHDDVAGYRDLVRRAPVPIATGETSFSLSAFDDLLDAGVPNVVAELERVGGISGWLEVAQLAHDRSADVLSHLNPHVSAQLLATIPQENVWWEYVPWFDQLMQTPFEIDAGMLTVPRHPGSGLDLAPAAMERLSRTPWLPLTP